MHELDMALLQAIGAIENLLALPCCDLAELSRVRYQTARAVATRRQAVDRLVNAAMSEGGVRADIVHSLRSGSFEMRMRYTDHVSAWPTPRALQSWPEYVVASRELAGLIRAQVQAERDLLYPGMPPVHA